MSKKTRGPNFTSNEKEILVHLVTKYKDVIENKKTDAVTTATKNEGWNKLKEEFNSVSSFSVRNTEQLKTCWDNLKRNTRKDRARTKKELILTGGGRPNLPPTGPLQGQVEVLLGPTLSGLENPFDSDAQYSELDETQSRDRSMYIQNEIEVTINEPTAGPSTISDSDECSRVVQENEQNQTLPSAISKLIEDECLIVLPPAENEEKKRWNGWSPAALKTKISDTLAIKNKDSPSWLKRRRPKTSVHDKLLESKLELVELMKKNAEEEAKIKNLILEEQMKQEKTKTLLLELQLKEAQQNNKYN